MLPYRREMKIVMLDVGFLSAMDLFKHHFHESVRLRSEQSLYSLFLSSLTLARNSNRSSVPCTVSIGAMKSFDHLSHTFAVELE